MDKAGLRRFVGSSMQIGNSFTGNPQSRNPASNRIRRLQMEQIPCKGSTRNPTCRRAFLRSAAADSYAWPKMYSCNR